MASQPILLQFADIDVWFCEWESRQLPMQTEFLFSGNSRIEFDLPVY